MRVGAGAAVASGTGVDVGTGVGIDAGVSVAAGSGLVVGSGTAVAVGPGAVVGISVFRWVFTFVGSWVGFSGCVCSGWFSAAAVASGRGVSVGATKSVGTGSEQATRVSRPKRAVNINSFAMLDHPFFRWCPAPDSTASLSVSPCEAWMQKKLLRSCSIWLAHYMSPAA